MIHQACAALDLDAKASYMVGDKFSDVEMAWRVGAKGILGRTGYGAGEELHFSQSWPSQPDLIADDLLGAVKWILAREGKG